MRALQRVADKVCCNRQERNVYMKLGSLIKDETDQEKVMLLFKALCGECPLCSLPDDIKSTLPASSLSLNTCSWKGAKPWVQWWAKPTHLSMYNYYIILY